MRQAPKEPWGEERTRRWGWGPHRHSDEAAPKEPCAEEQKVSRREWDSNPRNRLTRLNSFQDCRLRPLGHPSTVQIKTTSAKETPKTSAPWLEAPPPRLRFAQAVLPKEDIGSDIVRYADGVGPHRHSDEAGSEGAVCPENHDTFGCTTRGAAANVNRLRKRAEAPRSKSPNSDEPAAKPRGAKNERLAEGVGFEPTEPLTRFTAFRVLRTRPDYATPPCRHGNSLRFRRVLSGALGVPCTRNPLMRDRIPARGR